MNSWFILCFCCCCSVAKSHLTLLNPMACSMPGFRVPYHLPALAQVHVHRVDDAVQPSHPLLPLLLLPSIFCSIRVFSNEWVFESGGQSIGASASASVLQKSIQSWFPVRLTGLISLLSKRLSWVFSKTTVQKHQFFGTQPSSQSNSHIHTWLLKNHSFD